MIHFWNARRYMIDRCQKKAEAYRWLQDDWSRVTFADYSVPVPNMADSWVLLFRLEDVVTCLRMFLMLQR